MTKKILWKCRLQMKMQTRHLLNFCWRIWTIYLPQRTFNSLTLYSGMKIRLTCRSASWGAAVIANKHSQQIIESSEYRSTGAITMSSWFWILTIHLINIWQMSWQTYIFNHGQTIYPMEKIISLNLLKIL